MPRPYPKESPSQLHDRTLKLRDSFSRMGGLAMIDLFLGDNVRVHIGNQTDTNLVGGKLVTNHGGGVLRVTEGRVIYWRY